MTIKGRRGRVNLYIGQMVNHFYIDSEQFTRFSFQMQFTISSGCITRSLPKLMMQLMTPDWVVFLSSGSKCKVNNRLPGAGITLFAKIFHVHCFPRHRAIGSIKIGSFKTGSIGLSQKFIRGNLKSEFSKSTKFGKWPYCLFKSLNHPHRCSKRKIVKMQFE